MPGGPVGAPVAEGGCVAALACSPVRVFQQDAELRYAWIPAPMPCLGVDDPEAALGRDDAALLAPEPAAALTALKRRCLASGGCERGEVAVSSPTATFVVDLTVKPLYADDGELAGIACAVIDITEWRRVEDALRESREMLAEAEHLAHMGSWEWDIDGDRIQWSDGLYEIYGLTPDTFDARWAAREQREQRVHPEDRERVEASVARALETGHDYEIEYRIVRPDGRVRRLHARAHVMVDVAGTPRRLAGTVQDVTEVRAAEEALERTAAELGHRAAELHRVTRHPTGTSNAIDELLTERQLEILALVADGYKNPEIAARLVVSETTVKWHMRQILRKLRVSNRAEAVARYVRTTTREP